MYKKFFVVSMFVALGSLAASLAFAHEDGEASPRYRMMEQMMGSTTLEMMEDVEIQMMGLESHGRMEDLMEKMFAGTISSSELTEMVQLMSGAQTGPGAQNMMARTMMGVGMQNAAVFGRSPAGEWQGMMNWGSMASGAWWALWLTALLVWIALILAVVVLVRLLLRMRKGSRA